MPAGIRASGCRVDADKIDNLHSELRATSITQRGQANDSRVVLFHAMARFGPKLERQQLLLSRFVGIATELFAISATCSFAQSKIEEARAADEVLSVADYFCRSARMRIDNYFAGVSHNPDKRGYNLVQDLMAGKHASLRDGIV